MALSRPELESFFHDLDCRVAAIAELDLHLANRFNVFRWLPSELSLSSIIRELLDPRGVHGQRDAFLRRFLDMVGDKTGLGNVAILRDAPPPKCEEFTRHASSPQRRIDIFLRPNKECAIGIENKPWAADQPGWVKDYSDHLAKCGTRYVLVYLTIDGRDPSGDDKIAADALGNQFLKMSYKEHIKGWLDECRQACQADKVRSFLKDFIAYVSVMRETGMFSEQDLELVVNYLREQPNDRKLEIADLVKHAWPEMVRRVANEFQLALAARLQTEFGDQWEVKPQPEGALLLKWGPGFRVSKRLWNGRFFLAFQFNQNECGGLYFGVLKNECSPTFLPTLNAKVVDGMGDGKQNCWWEWWSWPDLSYRDWNAPETLARLEERKEALSYFADLFEKMKQIAEPLIDSECSPS